MNDEMKAMRLRHLREDYAEWLETIKMNKDSILEELVKLQQEIWKLREAKE